MPILHPAATERTVEFVASPTLDLVNAMYFTALAGQLDGIDAWPGETRRAMSPELREELDFLFSYPGGEPGVMGAANDLLFAHREAWPGVDALLAFIRNLPAGTGEPPLRPGIQELVLTALRWVDDLPPAETVPDRDRLATALRRARRDVEPGLALYDRPEELRGRILNLIEAFYEGHYRADEARRLELGRDSVRGNSERAGDDLQVLVRAVTGREREVCIDDRLDEFTQLIFVPSLDLGPYLSCADLTPVHGLYYPCRPSAGAASRESEDTARLARVYRALADEERLQILRLLAGGERYAQQIVEATGLHQSVVSRHLSFLHAVGLVRSRRQGTMKFFSLQPAAAGELESTLRLFREAERQRPAQEGNHAQ